MHFEDDADYHLDGRAHGSGASGGGGGGGGGGESSAIGDAMVSPSMSPVLSSVLYDADVDDHHHHHHHAPHMPSLHLDDHVAVPPPASPPAAAVAPRGDVSCVEGLRLNRAYQRALEHVLARVDAQLAEHAAHHAALGRVAARAACVDVRRVASEKVRHAGSYFLGDDGTPAPLNAEAAVLVPLRDQLPPMRRVSKWSEAERGALRVAVRQQWRDVLRGDVVQRYRRDVEARVAAGEDASTAVDADGVPLHTRMQRELDTIDAMDAAQLGAAAARRGAGIVWARVAAGVEGRSAEDCRIQWAGADAPGVRAGAWGKDEDKHLIRLVAKYNAHHWEKIAEELGGGRTAAMCMMRYQRSLNSKLLRSKWTDDEDARLRAVVREVGAKNWTAVAARMDGRTAQQCLHRWTKALQPQLRKGKFLPEEDMAIAMAVAVYGKGHWAKVRAHVPTRSDVQIRERWCNVLDPAVVRTKWTAAEDEQLLAAVRELGAGKWAAVAARLGGTRTDNHCWRRWCSLVDGRELARHRDRTLIKNMALTRHWTGRAQERPALTVDDFELVQGAAEPAPVAAALPPPRVPVSHVRVEGVDGGAVRGGGDALAAAAAPPPQRKRRRKG